METFNRAVFTSLLRNFEELIRTKQYDQLVSLLEAKFDPKIPHQHPEVAPVKFYLLESPQAPEQQFHIVQGLPFFTLGAYGLYYLLKSN